MVQTILVLYMSQGLKFSDSKAYLLYGAFSSMLYFAPVVGGYIADRFIGFKNAIYLGGFLLMIGYALMAFPGKELLFLGLSVVIVGNGFFKPNVSGIVGTLYGPNDARRDGGFTLFYMGINLGSLIPPIFAGALVAAFTWGSGFFISALGMIVALITFYSGRKRLHEFGGVPEKSILRKSHRVKKVFYIALAIAVIIAILVLQIVIRHPSEAGLILILGTIGTIGVVLFYMFRENKEDRRKMGACLILIALSIGFWAVYNQTFTSLMLFAQRNMTKKLIGIPINAEFTQFFNPAFIVILSPILSRLWISLEEKGKNPSTPLKFSLGILFMAIGYFVLGGGILLFNHGGIASPWWLILSYFLQTVGELLISPIGLAMVTRLSPPRLVGMMMGVWFLTLSAAFAIGGRLATISDVPKQIKGIASLEIYSHAFFIYGTISLALAILSFLLIPRLKKWIGSSTTPLPTPKS